MIVLISVWPVFRSLSGERRSRLLRQLEERRDVGAQIRRRVRVRQPFVNRRVRVDHARRDRRIVRVEPFLERRERLMRRRLRQEDLGAAAPDQHQAIEPVRRLEPTNVVDELLGEILLVLALLDVRTVEAFDVLPVENGRHRLHGAKLVLDLIELPGVEDAGRLGRVVAVVLEDVPAAEHELVEPGERHEIADERRSSLRPLAQPNGAHLRQRADRLRDPFPDRHDACDGCRADCPEADEKNTNFALGGSNGKPLSHGAELYHPVSAVPVVPARTDYRRHVKCLPPSIAMVSPVIQPDAGETRNAMRSAISSGVPARPSGCVDFARSRKSA